ncbi:MAG: FCD domain-containing protein, partial [Gemmatimonadota bacterium]
LLVSRCPNEVLLAILETAKNRLYRYEQVLTRQREWQGRDHDNHQRIIDALRDGNRALAVEVLKHHWQRGAEIRASWLEQPDAPPRSQWTSLM